jgi:hypothetical protein
LKAVADYELGPGSAIPLPKALEAIEKVTRFIDCIEAVIKTDKV